jgi:hypothetical protein
MKKYAIFTESKKAKFLVRILSKEDNFYFYGYKTYILSENTSPKKLEKISTQNFLKYKLNFDKEIINQYIKKT